MRKKDKFYPLHIDVSRIMTEIGFELEDIIIWDRQHEYNNMKTLGYPWVFRVNKVHEFLCIFWKREVKIELKKKKTKVEKVMHEFKSGQLHSGSKKGPEVTNPKQAFIESGDLSLIK